MATTLFALELAKVDLAIRTLHRCESESLDDVAAVVETSRLDPRLDSARARAATADDELAESSVHLFRDGESDER